jgi:Dirigent-like protein
MSTRGQIALVCLVALLGGALLIGPVASQTASPTPSQSQSGSASPTPSGSASPTPSPSPSDPDHITIVREDPGNDDTGYPIIHAGRKPMGFSRGDITTFSTPLLLPGTSTKDGRLTGQCQVLASTRQKVKFLCNAEAIFDEGRLTGFGTVVFGSNQQPATIAITGGTGDYVHARGEVTVSEDPNLTTFHVHLEE